MDIQIKEVMDNETLIDVCCWMDYINQGGKYNCYFKGEGNGKIKINIERRNK